MPTFNSTQYANATAQPARFVAGRDFEANVRCMVGSITFPAGIAANDVVRLFTVPAGARIVALHLHKTGTASFSVAVGTSTTSDRFSAAASLGASDPSAALVASRDPAPLAADTLVQAEITGSPAANQVLTVTAFYLAP